MSASRDHEQLTEAAILGMQYLRITVYPMDQFEEGAELLANVAQFYIHSHGYRIKRAFARVLCAMILPVARTASAELHHPIWQGAMMSLLPKVQGMAARARYWSVAYPLWCAALCAAVPDVVLAQWTPCLEAGQPRLKEGATRPMVLQCAAQLLYVYLFRCHEGTNATVRRMDAFFTTYMPAHRPGLSPADTQLEPYVAMVTCALHRQFEYARPLLFSLLRKTVLQDKQVVHQPDMLHPTRMRIAIRAMARAVNCYRAGEPPRFPDGESTPLWTASPQLDDTSATPIAYPSEAIATAQTTINELVGQIALIADYQVKEVNVFDERVAIARGAHLPAVPGDRSALDRDQYVVRTHVAGAFTVVYPREQQAYIDLLRACFDVWPYCLSSSPAITTVLAMLYRAQNSAEPMLQRASAAALLRIARHRDVGALHVVQAYTRWAFRQDGFVWELAPHAEILLPKLTQSVRLFIDLLDVYWTQRRYEQDAGTVLSLETLDETEACALYILCAPSAVLRQQATTIFRLLAVLHDESAPRPLAPLPRRVMHLLELPQSTYLSADHPALTGAQRASVARWTTHDAANRPLSMLATATDDTSQALWLHALPAFLEACARHTPASAARFYTYVLSRAKAMDASLRSARATSMSPLVRICWRTYTMALCAITGLESADVLHGDVVPLLVPYLSNDDAELREGAAQALGCTHRPVYVPLLAALHAVAQPVHEETKLTSARLSTARVVYQTASRMPKVAEDARVARLVGAWLQDAMSFLQLRTVQPTLELCTLRRYFCGVAAQFYKAIRDEDREDHFSNSMRLEIFGWLHEWSSAQGVRRLAAQLALPQDAGEKERALAHQRHELHLLSAHADYAMAALCAGPLPETPRPPFDVPALMVWIRAKLSSTEARAQRSGREALQALLEHNGTHAQLLHAVLLHSFEDMGVRSAPRTLFGVMATVYVAMPTLALESSAVLAVALVHLAHPDTALRGNAMAMLEAVAQRQQAAVCLTPYAVRATSLQPSSYLAAQLAISTNLAQVWPEQRTDVLGVLVQHLDRVPASAHASVLAILPPWLQGVAHLAPSPGVDDERYTIFVRVAALTRMYGPSNPLQIRTLWTCVFDARPKSGVLIAEFVVQLAMAFGCLDSVHLAQVIIACVDERSIRAVIFAQLCERLQPQEHRGEDAFKLAVLMTQYGPLAASMPARTSHSPILTPARIVFLLLSECVCADEALLVMHLPLLLHTLCVQLVSLPAVLRDAFASTAEQVLRGISTIEARGTLARPAASGGFPSHGPLTRGPLPDDAVIGLAEERRAPGTARGLADAISAVHVVLLDTATQSTGCEALVAALSHLAAPAVPALREAWGVEAVHWATTGPASFEACRSLQVLRALHCPLQASMLGALLAQLAATIAHAHNGAEACAHEVLLTLRTAVLDTPTTSDAMLATLFWAAAAAASTPIEEEFGCVVALLHTLLDRIAETKLDLHVLAAAFPADCDLADPGLQRLLLRGLRSATYCDTTFTLLVRLAALDLPHLDESADVRALVLLTAAMPWCMHACDIRTTVQLRAADARAVDPAEVAHLGEHLTRMAQAIDRPDMARVTQSISVARFRSSDEVARQTASCIANACIGNEALGVELVLLLLNLLYCECEWLCRQTLLALSALLDALCAQKADGGVRTGGAPLLDPLLALLATPLAPLALDVLDAPALARDANEARHETDLFGVPSASGWGVPRWRRDAARARHNVGAVSRAWAATLHEMGSEAAPAQCHADELDSLAVQLDDLASYFGQSDEDNASPTALPEHMAQILSRSNYRTRDSVLFAAPPPALDTVLTELYGEVVEEEISPTATRTPRSVPYFVEGSPSLPLSPSRRSVSSGYSDDELPPDDGD